MAQVTQGFLIGTGTKANEKRRLQLQTSSHIIISQIEKIQKYRSLNPIPGTQGADTQI